MQKMMESDLDANRAREVQSLLEEQTQSLFAAFVQNEKSVQRKSTPNGVTRLMMFSDLVKDLLTIYSSIEDEYLVQMDWLCPLLSSYARSVDPSIQEAIQVILDRAIKAGEPEEEGGNVVEIADNGQHKAANDVPTPSVEKKIADV